MYTYVCLEVALRGAPMESDVQLGQGEGPIKSGPNVPTARYHRYRVTHTGSYLCTYVRFLSRLYSRQLRVSCFLMFRGARTHRARYSYLFNLWSLPIHVMTLPSHVTVSSPSMVWAWSWILVGSLKTEHLISIQTDRQTDRQTWDHPVVTCEYQQCVAASGGGSQWLTDLFTTQKNWISFLFTSIFLCNIQKWESGQLLALVPQILFC